MTDTNDEKSAWSAWARAQQDEDESGESGAATMAVGDAASAEQLVQRQQQPPIPSILPVLPIRGLVMFPGTVMPLAIGRPNTRRLLDESLPHSKVLAFFTQRDEQLEEPGLDDLYDIGVAGMVLKLLRQPDESVQIIVHGLQRIRIKRVLQQKPYLRAEIEPLEEKPGSGKSFEAAVNQLRDQARQLIEASPDVPDQAQTVVMNIEAPANLADFLAANLNLEIPQKQTILEQLDVKQRILAVHGHVARQLEMARLQQKIQQDVQSTFSESQRRAFLREQMRAIQRELGEQDGGAGETVQQLRERIEKADPPEHVMEEVERELGRLEAIPPASPEYSMLTSYLELIAELPWQVASEDNLDLDRARWILDRDHFDLEKVKRRLIEYLAVRKLNPEGRGPILCLVGPPGVGKTSLGQSIADALGRQFSRMSLGGIRDEAEIRGHRRTYIGAMPGRIIQEIRRCGTNNPVMMLDELDKLGADFRGDPASALLEVLDPRQNHQFVDRYLNVAFDLSQVIFIGTANYMGTVPPALRDRLEVIDIPGYADPDKLEIARRYLVPRQLKENGLKKSQCRWRAAGIRKVIEDYTRESGVRELERQIGAVCRAVAAKVADAKRDGQPAIVDADFVRETLGPEYHVRDRDTRIDVPGVAIGLAYTPTGGEILFIEAAAYPGKGNITLTGQIGDVMKESANAALSLFKSRAPTLGYDVKQLQERDLHIHVPAGAIPKDGPSAGIPMFTAVASLLLEIPVKNKIAMTGEVTLRGKVLPVGGIKEKTLAAERAGIKTIILPEKNRRDLEEVNDQVKKRCRFEFVENVDQVLALALGRRAQKLLENNQPARAS
ncbi:MAG: endopeptidase La [Phycisphaeraceae bacterium]